MTDIVQRFFERIFFNENHGILITILFICGVNGPIANKAAMI